MGDYVFVDATSGDKVRVEYTFCYKRCEDGKVRICLHHSSVPYAPAGPAPITEAEVLAAQKLWADSIAAISAVYAAKGDYVAAAGEAAGKLYGYGKSDVLFKPTKATKNPFRPTAQAMGDYVFTDATSGDKVRVEYTFGYKRNDDGKVRIYLHHSSVPYAA